MAAFDPATLERWRALAIVDRDGITVGTISEFYLDRETGYPSWALVETGLFGPTLTFVPLVHATEISDGLQVPYEKDHIKDSPRVDIHDELTPEEEAALFAHYGVDYEPVAPSPPGVDEEAVSDAPPVTPDADPESGEPPGPVAAAPELAEAPPVVDADRDPGDTPGSVPPEPGSADSAAVVEGEGGSARAGSTEAATVEQEPAGADGGRYGSEPDTVTAGVPDEPGTTDPDEPEGVDRVGVAPGVERRNGPPDLDADPDRLRAVPADPDLGRTAPVEPGLPGSTAASPYGATATVDKGAGPTDHAADEPLRAPGEPGWAPGAAGSFEAHDPVDPPAGASDRWREAKLAAERDRIARAAAQPEERSPLERARRRLERLVGVAQDPDDHDEISPADREAAERARRARLGLDEEDHPRR